MKCLTHITQGSKFKQPTSQTVHATLCGVTRLVFKVTAFLYSYLVKVILLLHCNDGNMFVLLP